MKKIDRVLCIYTVNGDYDEYDAHNFDGDVNEIETFLRELDKTEDELFIVYENDKFHVAKVSFTSEKMHLTEVISPYKRTIARSIAFQEKDETKLKDSLKAVFAEKISNFWSGPLFVKLFIILPILLATVSYIFRSVLEGIKTIPTIALLFTAITGIAIMSFYVANKKKISYIVNQISILCLLAIDYFMIETTSTVWLIFASVTAVSVIWSCIFFIGNKNANFDEKIFGIVIIFTSLISLLMFFCDSNNTESISGGILTGAILIRLITGFLILDQTGNEESKRFSEILDEEYANEMEEDFSIFDPKYASVSEDSDESDLEERTK